MSDWKRKAERAWQAADDGRITTRRNEWLTALILANRLRLKADSVSEDTATKLRAAWAIFTALRHHDAIKARELRSRYGYRRFVEMGALWIRYEFAPAQAVDHLESDLSNTAMTMQIIDCHDPRPEWYRKAQGMIKQSEVIFTSYDAPDDFKKLIKPVREYLERYQL
jgi:hypothetical protein